MYFKTLLLICLFEIGVIDIFVNAKYVIIVFILKDVIRDFDFFWSDLFLNRLWNRGFVYDQRRLFPVTN